MRKGFLDRPKPAAAGAAASGARAPAPPPTAASAPSRPPQPRVIEEDSAPVEAGRDFILRLDDGLQLLLHILARLMPIDRLRASQSCKRLRRLWHDPASWPVSHTLLGGSFSVITSHEGPREGPVELLIDARSHLERLLLSQMNAHVRGDGLESPFPPGLTWETVPRSVWGKRLARLELLESPQSFDARRESAGDIDLPKGLSVVHVAALLSRLVRHGAPLRALSVECSPEPTRRADVVASISALAPSLRTLVVGGPALGSAVAQALVEAGGPALPALRGLALSTSGAPPSLLGGLAQRCSNLRRLALDARGTKLGDAPLLDGPSAASLLQRLPALESLALATPAPVDAEAASVLLGGASVQLGDGTAAQHAPTRGVRFLALRWATPDGCPPAPGLPAPLASVEASPTVARLRLLWQRSAQGPGQADQQLVVRDCPALLGLTLAVLTSAGPRAPRPWGASLVMRRGADVRQREPHMSHTGRRPRAPERWSAWPPRRPEGAVDWDASDDLPAPDEETEAAFEEDDITESLDQEEMWRGPEPPPEFRLRVSGCPRLQSFNLPCPTMRAKDVRGLGDALETARLTLVPTRLAGLLPPSLRHLHILITEAEVQPASLDALAALPNLETLTLTVNMDTPTEDLVLRLPACRSLNLASRGGGMAIMSIGRLLHAGQRHPSAVRIEAPRLRELVVSQYDTLSPVHLRAPELRTVHISNTMTLLSNFSSFVSDLCAQCPRLEKLGIVGTSPTGLCAPLPHVDIRSTSLRELDVRGLRFAARLTLATPRLESLILRGCPALGPAIAQALAAIGHASELRTVLVGEMDDSFRELDLTPLRRLQQAEVFSCQGLRSVRADSPRLTAVRSYNCPYMARSGFRIGPSVPKWCSAIVYSGADPSHDGDVAFWSGTEFVYPKAVGATHGRAGGG
eukprot:tig00000475_g1241.t1